MRLCHDTLEDASGLGAGCRLDLSVLGCIHGESIN